jgi:hypothetical protein
LVIFTCTKFTFIVVFLQPVKRELVELHGAHEGDVGQLVVEELLTLHYPQTSQRLHMHNQVSNLLVFVNRKNASVNLLLLLLKIKM